MFTAFISGSTIAELMVGAGRLFPALAAPMEPRMLYMGKLLDEYGIGAEEGFGS